MTTTTPAGLPASPIDAAVPRSIASDAALVVAGAVLTGLLAQLAVPLWPVPITGQTLAVLLVGAALGPVRGAASLALYAVVGVLGVPWFSDGSSGWQVVAGPTGGYILGFVAAAWLVGWLGQRAWTRRWFGGIASLTAGTVVVFAFGLPWLAVSLGLDLQQTLVAGLYPFILGGVIKALVAGSLIRGCWALADRRTRS